MRSPLAERSPRYVCIATSLTRWVPRILTWIGIFIWLTATLDLLGLDDSLTDAAEKLLDFHIAGGRGRNHARQRSRLLPHPADRLLRCAAQFASCFREEVLRRFQLSRGLPELISSTLYYLILLLVFLSAVNVGGIELNKFTVLTGAIGVGFGFGLQNIINNFVSGLILQFERPIHIDDILEVDSNTGKGHAHRNPLQHDSDVSRRRSHHPQRQPHLQQGDQLDAARNRGAAGNCRSVWPTEPIPNWCLKLLREAAAKHECVLTKPEPMVYFKGFGDSSLDFELHFWVMQENNGIKITSEVALAAMQVAGRCRYRDSLPAT